MKGLQQVPIRISKLMLKVRDYDGVAYWSSAEPYHISILEVVCYNKIKNSWVHLVILVL